MHLLCVQAREAKKEARHEEIIRGAHAGMDMLRASQGMSGNGGPEGWFKVSRAALT